MARQGPAYALTPLQNGGLYFSCWGREHPGRSKRAPIVSAQPSVPEGIQRINSYPKIAFTFVTIHNKPTNPARDHPIASGPGIGPHPHKFRSGVIAPAPPPRRRIRAQRGSPVVLKPTSAALPALAPAAGARK